MSKIIVLAGLMLTAVMLTAATFAAPSAFPSPWQDGKAPAPTQEASEGKQYSGTYTFLQEGEFVSITVEDAGQVTGYISRFDDSEKEKDSFVEQFFKSGKLEGNQLTFTTKPLRDVSFEFTGTVERGEGKNPGDEAYFVLTGTLTQTTTGADKKTSAKKQEVNFRKFPEDIPDQKN